MSLRDLVAKKSEIAESAIEEIVSKYIRYYIDTHEIGFTPEYSTLNGESKLLVYLVAILGWQFVTDNPPTTSTKPADLEKAIGIPGGTLRPLLKNLKDAHFIAPSAEGYAIREGNLEAIAAAINGEKKSHKPRKANQTKGKPSKMQKTTQTGALTKRPNNTPISPRLDGWIEEGFFKTPRTLKSVHERLHEHGIIAKQTSISGPLLKAVQQGRLTRKKIDQNGKEVWAYCIVGA